MAQLVDDVPDLLQRIRMVVVFFLQKSFIAEVQMGNSYQEIKYRETQELKQKAHVAPVVEPTQHFTT